MSKVKTVVVVNIGKLHSLLQATNWKAQFHDEGIFKIDNNTVRINLFQKDNVSSDDFRAWVKSVFSEREIKSMH